MPTSYHTHKIQQQELSQKIFFKKPFPLVNYELLSLSAESCFTCIVSTSFLVFFCFISPPNSISYYIYSFWQRDTITFDLMGAKERERETREGVVNLTSGRANVLLFDISYKTAISTYCRKLNESSFSIDFRRS